MKIEVLSIDSMELAAEAWRLSRDVDVKIDWRDIYNVDSPCNEMPSAFLHFRGFTILEREIFASSRTHCMWARTSFVDSPDKYELPRDLMLYAKAKKHEEYRNLMEEGKNAGQHQDEWRVHLPVTALTAFTMRVSYRDAIKFAKYFFYLADVVAVPLRDRFHDIALELAVVVSKFTGDDAMTANAISLMSFAKFLHEGDVSATNKTFSKDMDIYTTSFSIPFWLRAHFVRHRPITIADDMFQMLLRDDVVDLPISYELQMKVSATKDIWLALMGKRACWLTQSTLSSDRDPWDAIIEPFGIDVLPCSGGKCPYHRDARNRLEGTDPGIPCLRYIDLNDIDIDPWREQIEQALKSRAPYWTEMYHDILERGR